VSVARNQLKGGAVESEGSATFSLTSANKALHAAHPEVVLGPGAISERVGLFALFGFSTRAGLHRTSRRIPRLLALR
jgi:hypothetical protein